MILRDCAMVGLLAAALVGASALQNTMVGRRAATFDRFAISARGGLCSDSSSIERGSLYSSY
jgi:hypothetical protein